MPSNVFGTYKEMQVHPVTLRFPGTMEKSFKQQYNIDSNAYIQIGIIFSLLLYSLFGVLDYLMIKNITPNYFVIRYGIVIPFSLFILGMSYFKRFVQYMQLLVSYTIIVGGTGLVAIVGISREPINHMYYAGLLLVLMANFSILRIRFMYASLSGWFIFWLYLLSSVYIIHVPNDILMNNVAFLLGTNFIGMFSAYYFEFAARRDFYNNRLLNKEKEKVHESNLYLEKRIEERTRQLIYSNQALTKEIETRKQEEDKRRHLEEQLFYLQKMESIGTLAGGIAHDFNNILATILGYAEIIDRSGNIDASTREYVKNIEQASLRAKNLIIQLQTFSRQMKPKMVTKKLDTIVTEAVNLLKPLLTENIKLTIDIADNTYPVEADHNQVHQVMMNLCTNAKHAMKGIDGQLNISLYNTTVAGPDGKKITCVCLEISDNGCGMDEKTRQRIFEPYFTTKAVDEGHGLGLSMVHGIVKNHKGFINCSTKLKEGTTFVIYFPAKLFENGEGIIN